MKRSNRDRVFTLNHIDAVLLGNDIKEAILKHSKEGDHEAVETGAYLLENWSNHIYNPWHEHAHDRHEVRRDLLERVFDYTDDRDEWTMS